MPKRFLKISEFQRAFINEIRTQVSLDFFIVFDPISTVQASFWYDVFITDSSDISLSQCKKEIFKISFNNGKVFPSADLIRNEIYGKPHSWWYNLLGN